MKTHEQVVEAISKAGTRMAWDWNTVSGDTFPEKYESVYVKLVEMTSVLIRKGLKGYFWVVCDSILGELFEKWLICGKGIFPMGVSDIESRGILNKKWEVFVDPLLEYGHILVGADTGNLTDQNMGNCGVIVINNMVAE